MSFAKKLKRKKAVKVKRAVQAVASSIMDAEKLGRKIAYDKKGTVHNYYLAKILTAASYIMNTQFEWSLAKLEKMSIRYKYFVEELLVPSLGPGPCFLKIEWLREGLADECKFEVPKAIRPTDPEDATSVEAWVDNYAKAYAYILFRHVETIWLWILHVDFGFGNKRLSKFHELFWQFGPVEAPVDMIYKAMDQLDTVTGRGFNEDGTKKKIRMGGFRSTLKRIGTSDYGGPNLMKSEEEAA